MKANTQKSGKRNNHNDAKLSISGGAFFSVADLKKATKLTLFEKFCLWFVRPKYQIDQVENHTLKYKIFRGKMYVLGDWINNPKG